MVTDGRHFESPAEIAMMKCYADIVWQSLSFVVNYGAGIFEWSHELMKDIFFDDAELIGKILIDTIKNVESEKICHCSEYRKETLLKEVYD